MQAVVPVILGSAVALAIGVGLSIYLQRVRRPQLETRGGIAALAAMRWREFSHFVIEALQAQGFEVSRTTPLAERGRQADLLLTRDGRDWLLSCKQGANYRISRAQVDELADAVRFDGAAGGVLATLGRVEPEAHRHSRGIELIDGRTLWGLIDPLIPPSLHRDLSAQAQAQVRRETRLGWLLAAVAGLAVAATSAMLVPMPSSTPGPAPATASAASPASAAAPPTLAGTTEGVEPEPAPAPSDAQQRRAVAQGVSTVPGVQRAVWSTPSTLLVYQSREDIDARVPDICAVLERYPDLRASRLQFQPPAGSANPVRFRQCHAF